MKQDVSKKKKKILFLVSVLHFPHHKHLTLAVSTQRCFSPMVRERHAKRLSALAQIFNTHLDIAHTGSRRRGGNCNGICTRRIEIKNISSNPCCDTGIAITPNARCKAILLLAVQHNGDAGTIAIVSRHNKSN
jgi:hypothetical protein